MKELLETIIKNLVSNPEAVSIKEIQEEESFTYEVKVAESDMGRVIGRQGRVAKAIRSLMKAVATKTHKKIIIEFVD